MRAAAFVLVALGLGGSLAAQEGLVRNGGFSETAGEPAWPTGWSAAGKVAGRRFRWSDVDGFESSSCMTVRAEKGTDSDQITQSVPCTPDTPYLLSAALKGSGTCRAMVRVLNAATGAMLAQVEGDTSGVWRRQTRRFDSGNAAKLLVQLRAAGKTGVAAIDAVQILPAAAPIEPAMGAWFTPPGPNLARGKNYTLHPRPSYGYCTDPDDRTQLTDGTYTSGYFWTQKSTVGWTRASPVTITIDLGKVQPIAGASYNTAAGVAGVTWPAVIIVLVSDDRRVWYKAGDLVRETVSQAPPPEKGYHVYRFAAGNWRTKGRYVRLMISQTPYCFVDEIEVYAGDPAWLAVPHSGEAFNSTKAARDELFLRPQITTAVVWRLRTDLEQVKKRIEAIPRPAAAGRVRLSARIETLRKRIEALPDASVDLRTILPLNELHRDILALNSVVLRARGFTAVTAWKNNRWAPLGLLDAPDKPPVAAPRLGIALMRGEVRGETFNLTNPFDHPVAVGIAVTGLPGGDPPPYVSVRQVLVTDTRARVPVAAALPEAKREGAVWQVSIPAGCTRQVWLSFERPPRSLPGGSYTGTILVTAPDGPGIRLPLELRLFAFDFPAEPTLALGGWDYTNGSASYYRAPGNLDSLLDLFQDQGVNTPWATSAVAPREMQFDKSGTLLNPRALDFSQWDEWVARWEFARNYLVFLAVGNSFQGEKMGTARFNRMVGDWFQAWADHVRDQGIAPERVGVLLVDEPHAPAQDAVIIAWAKAIKAVGTGIRIFEDPTYRDPGKGTPEMFQLSDILCPNTPMMVSQGEKFRRFYLDQKVRGRTLWLYSCSGPAKQLDPCAYHRGQMWWALRMGATGCFYWAFGCGGGIGDSWRAYAQPRTEYAPFFVGQKEVTDAKHMEAIREGVEDYEYFVMLRSRIAELKKSGVRTAALAAAERLLTEGPRRVTETITPQAFSWSSDQADHEIMDKVRCEVLDLLEKLEKAR